MNDQLKFLNKEISAPVGIITIVLVILLAGGIIAWQYSKITKEKVKVPEEKVLEEKIEEAAPEEVIEDETANWKAYRNEEYGFEIKYPDDWEVTKNIFRFEPNLVFCPFNLAEQILTDPYPEIICKLKTSVTKLQYEEGMIYLFAYDSDPKPDNPRYHYLGLVSGKYYYLYSEGNESIVNQMLSTFKFSE